MKKIGVISDTHGVLPNQIYEFFKDVDLIIHAGDIGSEDVLNELEVFKPVMAVYGNIDGFDLIGRLKKIESFSVEGMKFLLTHIGGYPNKYEKNIEEIIKEARPDIFISGHSHILKVIYDKKYNLLHINPGAAGKYGFHQVSTLIRFEIKDKRAENLEIMEIKK